MRQECLVEMLGQHKAYISHSQRRCAGPFSENVEWGDDLWDSMYDSMSRNCESKSVKLNLSEPLH